MTTQELKKLIAAGESQTLEFKASFSNEAVESIAAFSNTNGGTVLLGVADNGQIPGLNLTAEKLQQWVNEVKTKTTPSILPEAEILTLNAKAIAALRVTEYPIKPVAFKGRYYKRVGSANHLMSAEEVARYHYQTYNTSWDYTIANEHGLQDISLEKVERFLTLANKTREIPLSDSPVATLKKLELLRADGISKACLLLFMNGESLLTTIEIGRFQTETLIKDAKTIKTDIFSEIDSTLQFLVKHLNKRYIITGNPQREERWDYPLDALREIIINAIVHRDYSNSSDSVIKIFDDKIEFFNPGRLLGSLTIPKLLKGDYISTIRNKQIAQIFKEANIIEKYGSGIRRIIESFRKYGLPAPKFRETGEGFLVTVFKGSPQEDSPERSEKRVGEKVGDPAKGSQTGSQRGSQRGSQTSSQKIVIMMSGNSSVTIKELAENLHISTRAVKNHIKVLIDQGNIKRIGPDFGGHWEVLPK